MIIYLASTASLKNGGGGLRNRGGAILKNTTIANNSVMNLNGQQIGGGGSGERTAVPFERHPFG